MSETADFSEDDQGGTRRLAFSGRLTLARIDDLPARLAALPADRDYAVDLSGVERMDTLGAFLIHRFARDRDGRVELAGATDRSEEDTSEIQSLMRNSYAVFC